RVELAASQHEKPPIEESETKNPQVLGPNPGAVRRSDTDRPHAGRAWAPGYDAYRPASFPRARLARRVFAPAPEIFAATRPRRRRAAGQIRCAPVRPWRESKPLCETGHAYR